MSVDIAMFPRKKSSTKGGEGRKSFTMLRGRPDHIIVKEQAGIALAKLSELGELPLDHYSRKRLARWLEEDCLDMSLFDFGKNRHSKVSFLLAIVNFMMRCRESGRYVIMVRRSAPHKGMIVQLTAVGRDYLVERCRRAHPSAHVPRVSKEGVDR